MARRMRGQALGEGQQDLAVQAGGEEEQSGGGLRDRQQDAGIGAGGRIDGGGEAE